TARHWRLLPCMDLLLVRCRVDSTTLPAKTLADPGVAGKLVHGDQHVLRISRARVSDALLVTRGLVPAVLEIADAGDFASRRAALGDELVAQGFDGLPRLFARAGRQEPRRPPARRTGAGDDVGVAGRVDGVPGAVRQADQH